MNTDLGFSDEDRSENVRRVAETAKLFMNCGIVTICSFVSPTLKIRNMARDIIGERNYFEVYIDVPMETLQRRDVKNLYDRALRGEIKNVVGVDLILPPPSSPDMVVDNSHDNADIVMIAAEVLNRAKG